MRLDSAELPVARRVEVLKSRLGNSPEATHLDATQYRTIEIRTNGRSVSEATGKAIDATSLLRALWTLIATRGSGERALVAYQGGNPSA